MCVCESVGDLFRVNFSGTGQERQGGYLTTKHNKSTNCKSSQVKSSQVKSSQVKSSQVKSSQVKSSQVKSTNLSSSIRHAVLEAPRGDSSDAVAHAKARGREEGPNDSRYPERQDDGEALYAITTGQ